MFKKLAVAGMVAGCMLAMSAVAGAHVEINADGPPAEDNVLTATLFAENECTGLIQSVQLVFPETPELIVGAPEETDGWTGVAATRSGTEAIESITWTNGGTADGDGSFRIALGEIATDQEPIEFKAIQTCADGEVFRWIEADGAEFPAPVLSIDHSGHEDDGHSHSDDGSDKEATPVKAVSDKEDDESSSTGIIVAVVAGVLVLGGGGLFMARRAKQS